jgi:diguanylate cyclase (GGDEF)-like protein
VVVEYMKHMGRVITGLLILGYIISTIVGSDLWGNIFSPIVTFIAFIIIYKNLCLGEENINKIAGASLSFGVLIWAITDIFWGIFDTILGINPMYINFITYGYSLTNLSLAVALFLFGYHELKNWNGLQLILDTVVITFIVSIFVWVIFLNSNTSNIITIKDEWNSFACIIIDILIYIWINIWFFSIRKYRVPMYISILITGGILYIITDLIYYYQYFFKSYDPNSLLDTAYFLSFVLIAIGSILKTGYKIENIESDSVLLRAAGNGKKLILVFSPLVIIIFKGFVIRYLIIIFVILIFYFLFAGFIQKNIYQEELLRKEEQLNHDLEKKIYERTQELIKKNKELDYLLNQDIVTGLYNRRYFNKKLDDFIYKLEKDEKVILNYIDINKYKMIKTMYGNYIGDRVLTEISKKLQKFTTDNNSILAKYGDDIFVYAVKGNFDYNSAIKIGNKIVDASSSLYHIEDYEIKITINIGISIYPLDANSKRDLLRHADIAMTQARMNGFNEVKAFDSKLGDLIFKKNELEIKLKRVSFDQEFMVYYQPQVNTIDQTIIGFEALIRWKTSTGEFIPPNTFIPIAEETGYIIQIGDWVIKEVLKQLVDWNVKYNKQYKIGINISLKQLNFRFVQRLEEELIQYNIEPKWIDIELVETIGLDENLELNTEMKLVFEKIRSLGITISIDDFGTGYSSYSYIKNLPIDRIKIAKQLIDRIDKDEFDYQIIKSVINIAKVKGIKVIAEGVETKEQWTCLKKLQCDEIQGYLFGKPMPNSEVETNYLKEL